MIRSSVLMISLLVTSSCALVGNDATDQRRFDLMDVSYRISGGFIPTSKLHIESAREVTAQLIGHGSGEVYAEGTSVLTEEERERLEALFSAFPSYRKWYAPEKLYTDGDTHEIVTHFLGSADTVSVYEPIEAKLPPSLRQLLHELESIHRRILPDQP